MDSCPDHLRYQQLDPLYIPVYTALCIQCLLAKIYVKNKTKKKIPKPDALSEKKILYRNLNIFFKTCQNVIPFGTQSVSHKIFHKNKLSFRRVGVWIECLHHIPPAPLSHVDNCNFFLDNK